MGRARVSHFARLKTGERDLYVIQHKESGLLLGYLRAPRPGITTWRAFYSNEYTERVHAVSWAANETTAEKACAYLLLDVMHRRLEREDWAPDHSHYILNGLHGWDDPVDLDDAAESCPVTAFELLRAISDSKGLSRTLFAGAAYLLRDAKVPLCQGAPRTVRLQGFSQGLPGCGLSAAIAGWRQRAQDYESADGSV